MGAFARRRARGVGRGGAGRGMPGTVERGAAGGAGSLVFGVRGALGLEVRLVRSALRGVAGFVHRGRALAEALSAVPGQHRP